MSGRLAAAAAMLFFALGAGANELNDAVKRDYDDYLWPLFDHFHRNPELSTVETKTAARMAEELRGAGFEVTEGVGGTGVVAMMKSGDVPVFLISSDRDPGEHLRLLTHLALRIEREGFREEWLQARSAQGLRETLLHHQRFLSIRLRQGEPASELIGQLVKDLDLPQTTLLAAVRRGNEVIFPRGDTLLVEGDRVTVVGTEEAIEELSRQWGEPA